MFTYTGVVVIWHPLDFYLPPFSVIYAPCFVSDKNDAIHKMPAGHQSENTYA